MVKKSNNKINSKNIILLIITLILSIIIIYLLISNQNKEQTIVEEVLFTKTSEEYNPNEKYYARITYKKFNNLWKSNNISTIAIIDNSSTTYNKFIELINKTAYYRNTKIYLLEISKLSKKEEVKFYEKDSRLSELETNYIITISNKKIISVTTFDNEELNAIIEGIGE